MNPTDPYSLRLLDVPGAAEIGRQQRQHRQHRFEQALRHDQGDGRGHEGGGRDSDTPEREAPAAPPTPPARRLPPSISPSVLVTLHRSLDSETFGAPAGTVLQELLTEIARSLSAGRRYAGDRWRFVVRLREELLPRTELEIACQFGRLSVTLRTSSQTAYRALTQALPRLTQALAERRLGDERVRIFLVSPADLP